MRSMSKSVIWGGLMLMLGACSNDPAQIGAAAPQTSISKEWKKYDLGTREKLNTVYFVNENLGFIAGNKGLLYKTVNGGVDWKKLTTGVNHDLVSISFNGKNRGVVNGLVSSDLGSSWVKSASTASYYCYYAGENNLIGGSNSSFEGTVFLSKNHGATWSKAHQIRPKTGFYSRGSFLGNTGYLASWYSGRLLKTNDSGASWNVITKGTTVPTGGKQIFDDFFDVQAISATTVYAVSNRYLSISEDGGRTFRVLYTLVPSGASLRSVYVEADRLVLTDSDGTVLLSTDGGKNWTLKTLNKGTIFTDVTIHKKVIFVIGDKGALWRKHL
ncbi:exported hypothetical protein [Tenacibaculum litopenaei]